MKSRSFKDLDVWIEFQEKVLSRYPLFYDALFEKHPQLSTRQIMLCSLLLQGCEMEEAVERLGVSPHAIYTGRSKLRKEFPITKETPLHTYLFQLARGGSE